MRIAAPAGISPWLGLYVFERRELSAAVRYLRKKPADWRGSRLKR